MTDSMKFGPEWLRNLSTDSSATSLSATGEGLSSMNINYVSTTNSSNNDGSCGSSGNESYMEEDSKCSSSSTITINQQHRNSFPQYRYGREELLSLFDRKCNMPEILHGYKKLFVEKVQLPLALTPSTDEDVLSPNLNLIAQQRASWIRRSPVGFPSHRSIGRGGTLNERGRNRAKTGYHSVFHRPTLMFEDGTRPGLAKSERSWSERNGGNENVVSFGGSGNTTSFGCEWNATPLSSPRREFPSQIKNLENWRKGRLDNGSTENTSSSVSSSEAWRGTSSGFNSVQKYGRSVSWREDDSSYNGAQSCGTQTKHTSIAVQEFSTGNTPSANGPRSLTSSNVEENITRKSKIEYPTRERNIEWTVGVDGEDNLPEWAMENSANVSGTFDASGAFHGSTNNKEDWKHSTSNNHLVDKCKDWLTSRADMKLDSKAENPILSSTDSKLIEKCDTHLGPENYEMSQKLWHSSEDPNPSDIYSTHDALKNDQANCTPVTSVQTYLSDQMQDVADDLIKNLIMEDEVPNVKLSRKSIGNASDNIAIENFVGKQDRISVNPITSSVGEINTISNYEKTDDLPLAKREIAEETIQTAKSISPIISPGRMLSLSNDSNDIQQKGLQKMAEDVNMAFIETTASELWFYRDPQMNVQGPFTALEMTEWYRAGYFDENLYVRRASDSNFWALGDLIKLCNGSTPFFNLFFPSTSNLHTQFQQTNIASQPLEDIINVKNEFQMSNQPISGIKEIKDSGNLNNVAAIAGSLKSAVKNIINPVDAVQALRIHFKLLQDQYIRQQELMVITELADKDVFQCLSPVERELFVKQKVRMIGLPDYLSNLSGLRNALSSLNSTVDSQLYNAILECPNEFEQSYPIKALEKSILPQEFVHNPAFVDDKLNNPPKMQHSSNLQTRPYSASRLSLENPCSNNIEKALSGKDSIHDFQLHALFESEKQQEMLTDYHHIISSRPKDVLNSQQITSLSQISPLQIFLPNVIDTNNVSMSLPLLSEMSGVAVDNFNQFSASTMKYFPKFSINSNEPNSLYQSQRLPGDTWGRKSGECNQRVDLENIRSNFNSKIGSCKLPVSTESSCVPDLPDQLLSEATPFVEKTDKNKENVNFQEANANEKLKPKQSLETVVGDEKSQANFLTDSLETLKEAQNIKNQQTVASKRNNSKLHPLESNNTKLKADERSNKLKQIEEERKKDLSEEKRRIKEKKRNQSDEEQRRLRMAEEDSRRQVCEEKERQQQIHMQRRKAMLGSNSEVKCQSTIPLKVYSKTSKEQQRVQYSVAPWSAKTIENACKEGPSLVEIQKAERRERQMEVLLEKQKVNSQTHTNIPSENVLKWNSSKQPVKAFAEIQAEEARYLAAQQSAEIQRRKDQTATIQNSNDYNFLIALDSKSGNGSNTWGPKVWGLPTNSSGLWEDQMKSNSLTNKCSTTYISNDINDANPPGKLNSQSQNITQNNTSTIRNLKKSRTLPNMQNTTESRSDSKSNKINRLPSEKKSSNTNIIGSREMCKSLAPSTSINKKCYDYQNEFNEWSLKTLSAISSSVDVPTFVTFLQDLESPYEVKDYIRMYLGEGKESSDFAKQFLERRSKYKNMQRAENAHNDDMCKPAPAITPLGNDSIENKGKQKKVKKNKMTKLDGRILGFSVTSAEGRINVGDRDYGDAS